MADPGYGNDGFGEETFGGYDLVEEGDGFGDEGFGEGGFGY